MAFGERGILASLGKDRVHVSSSTISVALSDRLAVKDLRLTLAAAESLRVPMPLASLLRDRFLTLLARGGEKLDWSAIGDLPRQNAGAP